MFDPLENITLVKLAQDTRALQRQNAVDSEVLKRQEKKLRKDIDRLRVEQALARLSRP